MISKKHLLRKHSALSPQHQKDFWPSGARWTAWVSSACLRPAQGAPKVSDEEVAIHTINPCETNAQLQTVVSSLASL